MTFSKTPFGLFFFLAMAVLSVTVVLKKWHFGLREEAFGDDAPERNRLLQQLQERHQELKQLYVTASEFMNSHLSVNDSVYYINGEMSAGNTVTNETEIGCEELAGMKAVDFLGSGYTKTVLKVALPQGLFVALKSVNHQGTDMRMCMQYFKDSQNCHKLVSFKLRKEIILLQRLQHPNIVQLKGQCQDSVLVGGITAILEQGMPLQMIQLLQSPWEERFRVCLGLVRLLQYLSQSPLGSVALLDFQPRQFVMVSGELKLTDLDDASIKEPACKEDSDCVLQFPLHNFTHRCSPSRICKGLNEMRNLYNAYRYFFTYLLPHQAPPLLKPLIHQIMNSTGGLKQSINETLIAFEEVLHLYQSGQHLQNLPPFITRDYAVLKGMRSVGNMEYRCWPSYNQQGCVLSVHSAKEAALICSSHPQCTSFSLSKEKTWTGRLLALFRSGFSHLVPDVNSAVYMRKVKASGAML
ncbi:extracellular tyrosine-protein kinase PKDCC-like [Xyrauchen texanus]|uniref:extracellular tyrosine-protein kinase PKDCC-like n=1 Tax=Xyrauchen texanus TaxID=154827 RepID=UPI002241EA7E|nr:extracellular tyrosine-protein kinase PKDCC-like [Xyrauchen texanus]